MRGNALLTLVRTPEVDFWFELTNTDHFTPWLGMVQMIHAPPPWRCSVPDVIR